MTLLQVLTHARNGSFIELKLALASIENKDKLIDLCQEIIEKTIPDTLFKKHILSIQKEFQKRCEEPAFSEQMLRLALLIKHSENESFSTFIESTLSSAEHKNEALTFDTLIHLLYPSLDGDHRVLFHALKEADHPIRALVPPQFSDYDDIIANIKGSPFSQLMSNLLSYGIGFAPYVLGNLVASKLKNVSPFYRLIISAAPTGLSGALRFIIGNEVEKGRPKSATINLLLASTIGLGSVFTLIKTVNIDKIQALDGLYWALLCSNMISGFGGATFSACLPSAAQAAPNDTVESWRQRLELLGNISPNMFQTFAAQIARKSAADYMAIIGGVGGLTPAITLLTAAFLEPSIQIEGIYGLFGGITFAGIIGSYLLLQDPMLDQLRHALHQYAPQTPINDTELRAREIAKWMGQKRLISNPHLGYFEKFKTLTPHEKIELAHISRNYVVTFGFYIACTATLVTNLTGRGIDARHAILYTAGVSGIAALSRSLIVFCPLPENPLVVTNISLASMALSSAIFASTQDPNIWLPMIFTFSFATGTGAYGVFAEASKTLPNKIALASGMAGGVGACSAVFISLMFALLSSTNQTECNSAHSCHTKTSNEYYLASGACVLALLLNLRYYYKYHTPSVASVSVPSNDIENNSRHELLGNHRYALFTRKQPSPTSSQVIELTEEPGYSAVSLTMGGKTQDK